MKSFYTYQFEDIMVYQTPTLWQTYRNYNYILAKEKTAIIVDPGEKGPIENTVEQNELKVEAIYLTHHHPDHTGATQALKKKYDCDVIGFMGDRHRLPILSQSYTADSKLHVLGHPMQVMHLPGHTTGLCAFYFADLNLLFSNDLIFSLGCGRVFEGTFPQMFESLKRVRALPDETLIFSSHEYTLQNLVFGLSLFPQDEKLKALDGKLNEQLKQEIPTVPTTLKFEKEHNPFLRWDDPVIRTAMELGEAEDWQVFAEIRRLKDMA